jgi:hypothetical protein
LKSFRKHEQEQILTAIENQLAHQADQETRNRKRLRPNQLAEWELRVGDFRVFYDIEQADTGQADTEQAEPSEAVVKIVAVGYKQGSKLFVHGEEYEL